MKRLIAIVLCLVMVLSFAACGNTSTTPETTEKVDNYNYPEIKDTLSWETLNAFAVKSADMTEEEMRQLCVDFFLLTKTFVWTPNADLSYAKNAKGDLENIKKGMVYGGHPYIAPNGWASIYRVMDYYNPETGVLDIERAAQLPNLFCNHCSGGTYVGWGRVVNSAAWNVTSRTVQINGFLRVGPYTYDDMLMGYTPETNTTTICQANGINTMFESYAQMHLADGLVNHSGSAGHVIMCTSEPHIEYLPDGSIDGNKSYIMTAEQHQEMVQMTNESGDSYLMEKSVDKKRTFLQLYNSAYLPFTYGEFLGTDPVEETQCSVDITGDSVSVDNLFRATVSANYTIYDAYISVKNSEGKEAYRHAVRSHAPNARTLLLIEAGDTVDTWGTLDISGGEYTVEIQCQLSTGERPTVYTGKLVQ